MTTEAGEGGGWVEICCRMRLCVCVCACVRACVRAKCIDTQTKMETETDRQSEIETDKDRDCDRDCPCLYLCVSVSETAGQTEWDADGRLVTKSGSVTVLSLHFCSVQPAVGLHDLINSFVAAHWRRSHGSCQNCHDWRASRKNHWHASCPGKNPNLNPSRAVETHLYRLLASRGEPYSTPHPTPLPTTP